MYHPTFTTALLAISAFATAISGEKKVTVDCADTASYERYITCFNNNAAPKCQEKTGPDYIICFQLWQSMCGQQAGCHVTDPSPIAEITDTTGHVKTVIL